MEQRPHLLSSVKYTAHASVGDFLRFLVSARPPAIALIVAALASLATTAGSLIVPQLAKGFVDGFSFSSLRPWHLAAMATAFVVQMAGSALSIYLLGLAGNKVVANLRSRLWQKQLSLKVEAYDQRPTGDYLSRFNNDTAVLKSFVAEGAASFITGIVAAAGSLVFLLALNTSMTLVMLLAIPLALAVMVPLGRSMRHVGRATMEENARFTSVLARVLTEMRLVKASGAESVERRRGHETIETLFGLGMREARIQALVSPLMGLVMMLLMVLVVGYGGWLVSSGALTAGSLVAFILYLIQIVMPIGQITTFFTQFQKARGATESLRELLSLPEESSEGRPLERTRGTLRLDHVSFGYGDNTVLHDVSLEFQPGSVTALVGPSGSGKTTIFSLIERFYEPQAGQLTLDNTPLTEFRLSDWRSRLGYVSQDSPMIDGTIAENISYGLGFVERDLIRDAARQANALEFIDAFPEGLETPVGERGVKLSGGQRQRIAIARALLRDPEWLLLDEATASLDSGSEALVQGALRRLMAGRTTIVIAHRLSTVIDADRIVFLEAGRPTGAGSHDELLSSHELYRRFAEHQFRLAAPSLVAVG